MLNVTACSADKLTFDVNSQLANPWFDCGMDLKKASQIAGFDFPLILSNYSVKAMKGMIEITYPLDENRNVIIRKSLEEINNGDISGVYAKYPVVDTLTLEDGVQINLRKDVNSIYVMYFGACSGIYSAYSENGMSENEVRGIFDLIKEVEADSCEPH